MKAITSVSWWLAGILIGLGALLRCLEEVAGIYVKIRVKRFQGVQWC